MRLTRTPRKRMMTTSSRLLRHSQPNSNQRNPSKEQILTIPIKKGLLPPQTRYYWRASQLPPLKIMQLPKLNRWRRVRCRSRSRKLKSWSRSSLKTPATNYSSNSTSSSNKMWEALSSQLWSAVNLWILKWTTSLSLEYREVTQLYLNRMGKLSKVLVLLSNLSHRSTQ